MSLHVEWMSAAAIRPETCASGVTVGEHDVTEPLGLVLGGMFDSSVVVIEGDRESLVRMLDAARESLDHPSTE